MDKTQTKFEKSISIVESRISKTKKALSLMSLDRTTEREQIVYNTIGFLSSIDQDSAEYLFDIGIDIKAFCDRLISEIKDLEEIWI
jgi:DNA-binding ferritin-like protein (Dps family)